MKSYDGTDHTISLLAALAFLSLMIYGMAIAGIVLWSYVSRSKTQSKTGSIQLRNHGLTIGLLLVAAHWESLSLHSYQEHGLADLIVGKDPKLQELLDRVPRLTQGPTPPWWLRNRHVQFLPWLIQNEIHRQQGIPYQRIDVPVHDWVDKTGVGGGVFSDVITLDVFPPLETSDISDIHSLPRSAPVILFSPGLRCHSQDMPGNSIVRLAYGAGFRSIVVHRRGHTPNQKLKSPRWNLFGDVNDMEQVYWYLRDTWFQSLSVPMFLHGISSGTAVTVTALSEWDDRRSQQWRSNHTSPRVPSFVASVSIAPGYDTSKVLSRQRFLWPYNDLLLGGVKDHFVVQNEDLLREHHSKAVDAILAASSLQEFVDAATPFAGYPNASVYYRHTNPVNAMDSITTPKLVINAKDDPCCHIGNLYEVSPYHNSNGTTTFANIISRTQRGIVAVSHTGSHCPFVSAVQAENLCPWWAHLVGFFLPLVPDPLTGGRTWMLASWADHVSIEYYRAALEVFSDRSLNIS